MEKGIKMGNSLEKIETYEVVLEKKSKVNLMTLGS